MTDKILWADDEIDLLKPHILFLKAKGYEVTTVSNGRDALDALENEPYSLILLDENMPGISGLETLALINRSHGVRHPGYHDNQKRGGKHHGPGDRQPDRGLSHKTG